MTDSYIGDTETLSIDDGCMESYPCQHSVTIQTNTGSKNTGMNGITIAKWFITNKIDVPTHFSDYVNWK